MWGAYFLNYCDRQAVFAMFPALKAELAMSDRQLGYVGAVFLWIYALGCPLAGVLGDRISKRLLAVGSLVVWSLVTLATGWARSGSDILALRGAMGISESLFMPTAIALTANAHPPALRSRAIAILTTAQIAGTVAGSVFGGRMADAGRWRDAFWMLGILGVAYAVPYFLFLRGARETPAEATSAAPSARAPSSLVRSLFGAPSFVVLCAVFPCFVFGLWLIYGWLPTFLHDKFDLTQADAAWNASIYLQSMTAVGLLGGGILSDWLYRRSTAARQWVLVVSLVCSAPSLYLIGAGVTLPATRLAAAAFGLSSGLFMGNISPPGSRSCRPTSAPRPSGSSISSAGWCRALGRCSAGCGSNRSASTASSPPRRSDTSPQGSCSQQRRSSASNVIMPGPRRRLQHDTITDDPRGGARAPAGPPPRTDPCR